MYSKYYYNSELVIISEEYEINKYKNYIMLSSFLVILFINIGYHLPTGQWGWRGVEDKKT